MKIVVVVIVIMSWKSRSADFLVTLLPNAVDTSSSHLFFIRVIFTPFNYIRKRFNKAQARTF